jgi:hypothetical protein
MPEKEQVSPSRPDDRTGKEHSRQGVDKAPGEETAGDTENTVALTQKGRNKNDGDPSKPVDQPVDRE